MPVTSSRSSLKRWPKPEVVLEAAADGAAPAAADGVSRTAGRGVIDGGEKSPAVLTATRPARLPRLAHMCYDRRMATVASRELRNRTRQLLERVEAGEDVTITVDGRPVARLTQVNEKPRWIHRDVLFAWLAEAAADPGLRQELDELVTERVDDREVG